MPSTVQCSGQPDGHPLPAVGGVFHTCTIRANLESNEFNGLWKNSRGDLDKFGRQWVNFTKQSVPLVSDGRPHPSATGGARPVLADRGQPSPPPSVAHTPMVGDAGPGVMPGLVLYRGAQGVRRIKKWRRQSIWEDGRRRRVPGVPLSRTINFHTKLGASRVRL